MMLQVVFRSAGRIDAVKMIRDEINPFTAVMTLENDQ